METSGTLTSCVDFIRDNVGQVIAGMLRARALAGEDYVTESGYVLFKQSGVWWFHD